MIPRIEQKFELKPSNYGPILSWLHDKNYKLLFPSRLVSSIYFDNSRLQSFVDTIEGITPRRKIRVRGYGAQLTSAYHSQSPLSLEIKLSGSFQRCKSQQKISNQKFLDFVDNGFIDSQYGICHPRALISYTRDYYASEDLRVTIDRDICYSNYLDSSTQCMDDLYVFEVKTSISKGLMSLGNHFCFPLNRFSKYERAVEALNLLS